MAKVQIMGIYTVNRLKTAYFNMEKPVPLSFNKLVIWGLSIEKFHPTNFIQKRHLFMPVGVVLLSVIFRKAGKTVSMLFLRRF